MIWYVNLVKLDSCLTLAHLFENLCTSVSKLYLLLLSSIRWIQNVGLKVSSIQNEFKELAMHRQIVCYCNLPILTICIFLIYFDYKCRCGVRFCHNCGGPFHFGPCKHKRCGDVFCNLFIFVVLSALCYVLYFEINSRSRKG